MALDAVRTWLPRSLATIAFCLYATLATPSFYWLDSAELSAAAVAMGVPHPTGFPLYCVLARIAGYLPIGELAFRINLLSAACAALTVFFSARLVIDNCRGDDDSLALAATIVSVLLLGLSATFLRQATVAEVYAPTAALLSGTLWLGDRVARGADARWGASLAVVLGLGLTCHVTYGLVAIPVLGLFAVRLYRGARWPMITPVLMLLPALALTAYMPLRTASGHIDTIDWAHADQVGRLLDHLSAARIRNAYDGDMGLSGAGIDTATWTQYASTLADHVGPFTPLAAMFGAICLGRRRRRWWLLAALCTVLIGDLFYAVVINPMGIADWQNGIPFSVASCICAGIGLIWLGRAIRRMGLFIVAAAGVLLSVPVVLLALPEVWPASSSGHLDTYVEPSLADSQAPVGIGRGGDAARALSQAALDQVPSDGVALVQSDSMAAGLMYLTVAEHARPDVAVLARQHVAIDVRRTRAVMAQNAVGGDWAHAGATEPGSDTPLQAILRSGRPIAWELGQDALPPTGTVVASAPLLYWYPPTSRTSADETAPNGTMIRDIPRAAVRLAAIFSGVSSEDRQAKRHYAFSLSALGRLAYARGRSGNLELADTLFRAALAVRPHHVAAMVNLGVVAARRGDYREAATLTERALTYEPMRMSARINAARYRIRMGDDRAASSHVVVALDTAPHRADAWALAALLDMRAGRMSLGMERLRKALAIDPNDADARDLARQVQQSARPRPQ